MNKHTDNAAVIFLCDSSDSLMHPFDKKQIVFTGALSTMTRSEAAKKVQAFGGTMQGAVTQETDFVILGDKRRGISTKQLKAEQLISHGLDIQIIPEADFLWLISMHKE
ncbi:DNA polymerase III subunit epsilon [Lysinibacillus fusiformis]|nr:DNA polymerase III subunit epsilon [Lysinibacillus fusiformis]